MYHGGCILFARHSFTAAPPILHKSPCAFVRVSALWLAFGWLRLSLLSRRSSLLYAGDAQYFLRDRKRSSNFNTPSSVVVQV